MGKDPSKQLPHEAGVRAALAGTPLGNTCVHRQAGGSPITGARGGRVLTADPTALHAKQLLLVSSCRLSTPDSAPGLLCWALLRSPQAGRLAKTQQLQSGSLTSSRRKCCGLQEASWPHGMCSSPGSLWGVQGQSQGTVSIGIVPDASSLALWAVPIWADPRTPQHRGTRAKTQVWQPLGATPLGRNPRDLTVREAGVCSVGASQPLIVLCA